MDPIRPYAYVHDVTNLDIYNVYTAGLVGHLSALGTSLGTMTISTDGSTLYVVEQYSRDHPREPEHADCGQAVGGPARAP